MMRGAAGWPERNQHHKQRGGELLVLTAERGGRLRTTWLHPSTQQQAVEQLVVANDSYASLTPVLPEVAWDEREIHDLFGYVPAGHPDLRPLVRTPRWPDGWLPGQDAHRTAPWRAEEPDNPAMQVQGEGITIMKVGPTHAGIIESGHFVFSLIGENVLHLDAHLFQNHRGIEARVEGEPVAAIGPMLARLCAADTVSHQTNWALAVEGLAGYEASAGLRERRVLLLEAERILSHLNDLAQIPAGVGFQVAHQRALALKERWQASLAALYGHRLLFDTVGPGSARGAPYEAVRSMLQQFRVPWQRWRHLVETHQGLQDRMRGVGRTTAAQVARLGAQGVAARAAGREFDARTVLPWYESRFVGPVTRGAGDVAARFWVRVEEVEASLAMMEGAARATRWAPLGDDPRVFASSEMSGRIVTFTESPHGLNAHEVAVEGGRVTRYHIRAGTYRNWPLLAQAVAGNAVADFPLINKSFELCYACTDR